MEREIICVDKNKITSIANSGNFVHFCHFSSQLVIIHARDVWLVVTRHPPVSGQPAGSFIDEIFEFIVWPWSLDDTNSSKRPHLIPHPYPHPHSHKPRVNQYATHTYAYTHSTLRICCYVFPIPATLRSVYLGHGRDLLKLYRTRTRHVTRYTDSYRCIPRKVRHKVFFKDIGTYDAWRTGDIRTLIQVEKMMGSMPGNVLHSPMYSKVKFRCCLYVDNSAIRMHIISECPILRLCISTLEGHPRSVCLLCTVRSFSHREILPNCRIMSVYAHFGRFFGDISLQSCGKNEVLLNPGSLLNVPKCVQKQ